MNETRKEEKVIEITINKALAIVTGAILTGLVGGAFTIASVLNTDHFITISNANDIQIIKENYANKGDILEIKRSVDYLVCIHLQPDKTQCKFGL